VSAAAVGTAVRPNLFVVGAPKAGTTALWRYLDHHPEIFMSKVKEPHYFSPDRRFTNVVRDPAAYARLFAGSGDFRYAGEASPTYLCDPGAARRIRAAVGSARILVSLRDPVERAYAGYWTAVRVGVETQTFEQAVSEELAGGRDDLFFIPPPHIARGFYAEQLERYLELFGDTVLVLMLEELAHDTRAAMRRIYAWLDLDPAPAGSLDPAPVFPFELPRSKAAQLALAVPGLRRLGDRVFRGRLRERLLRLVFDREKPPLDLDTRRLLREVYAPHDERLRSLLGRPLPWDGRE
jgi:Sulfotransferase domain